MAKQQHPFSLKRSHTCPRLPYNYVFEALPVSAQITDRGGEGGSLSASPKDLGPEIQVPVPLNRCLWLTTQWGLQYALLDEAK